MTDTAIEAISQDMRQGTDSSDTTGTVRSLLFTDIEGSTLLLQSLGDLYSSVLSRHNEILREAIEDADGQEVSTKGDSFFAVFETASDAVQAAVAAQAALQEEPWAGGATLRVRMGVHFGQVRELAGDFVGLDVHRAARIADAARGGQILLSRAARETLESYDLPRGAKLRDLGRHRLKDLRYPESLFDLSIPGLLDDFGALRSLGNRPTNLGESGPALFGRDKDVAAVQVLLEERSRRVVTVFGPGGIGKSSLAHRVGELALDQFPDGVHLVQLGGVTDPELVFPAVAQTIGVRDYPGRPILMDIAAEIGSERRLLIFDTFEHLVDAGAQVTQLVEACPNLHVLVTSRSALHLRPEVSYALDPLPMPQPDSGAKKIAAVPSVRLFVERVHEFDPGFEVTPENAAVIASICRRLEGIPLAIELGAARMKMLSPERLLDRLSARLSVLKGGRRDASLRHRTLRAAIEWSDNLLDPQDREVFLRLSVFSGGFALEDAEDVLEDSLGPDVDVLDGVESLVGKSLVRRGTENGEPRFDMYDMIRDYARDTLTEEGLAQRLRDRHMDHFAAKAEIIGANALGEGMRPYLLQLLSDVSNHRAALGWALESGNIERAAQIIYALHWVWISQATFTEALSWIDKAAAKLKGAPDSRDAALIHEAACSLRMAAGDYVGGLPHGSEAKRLYTALDDADGVARIELTRSICATVSGEMEDPSEILMGSIAHFRDRDANTAALGMILLGEGARMAGALDAAEGCYAEALQIYAADGNVFWPSHLKQNIAHFRLKDGRWQEAAGLLAEAFDLAEDYNFVMVSNLVVSGMSGVALQSGDARLAAMIQGGAEAHRTKIGAELEPTDKADIQSYIDGARHALGKDEYAAAAAEGAAMDWELLKTLARGIADPAAIAA